MSQIERQDLFSTVKFVGAKLHVTGDIRIA